MVSGVNPSSAHLDMAPEATGNPPTPRSPTCPAPQWKWPVLWFLAEAGARLVLSVIEDNYEVSHPVGR